MTTSLGRFGLVLALFLFGTACQALRLVQPAPTAIGTPTPVEATVSYLQGRGVEVVGRGDATTEQITPQYTQGITVGISLVTVTHDGQSDFTVQAIENSQLTVLVAATGHYQGSRPLVVLEDVVFQVKADGNWTIRVEPLRNGGQPAFSGTGDAVSQFFDPPSPGQWLISGGGAKLRIDLHCLSGDAVVVDVSAPYRTSATITFSRGPCFWEVQSDGNWSLTPQFAAANPTPTPRAIAQPTAPAPTLGPLLVSTPPAKPSATAALAPATAAEAPDQARLLVFAASSLADPLQELATAFLLTNPPAAGVRFDFAASSQLPADADIVISADQAQFDSAAQANRLQGQARNFARSRLVLLTPNANPKQLGQVQDLVKPGVRWVTTDPADRVAQATLTMLDRASADPAYGPDFRAKAERNILARTGSSGDVVSRVQQGEADATVVYTSDLPPQLRDQVHEIEIPDALNVVASYSIAVVKGPNTGGAEAFLSFVFTQRAQDILGRWGLVGVASGE